MTPLIEGPRPSAAEERCALEAQLLAIQSDLAGLTRDLAGVLPPGTGTESRLERLERLGRELEVLLEWAREPAPKPRPSTLEEILCAARLVLPGAWREKLWLARCDGERHVTLDGPLVAKCLARLARSAMLGGAERVLLAARVDEESVVFSIVDRAGASGGGEIELGIVRRDAALMRGTLTRAHGPKGSATTLVFPMARPAELAAQEPSRGNRP